MSGKERIEEIDLLIAAVEDVSKIMLQTDDKVPGGECLHVLAEKLHEAAEALWSEIKMLTNIAGGER